MWRFALLAPLLAAASPADQRAEKNNSTSAAVSYLSTSQLRPLDAQPTASPTTPTLSKTKDAPQASSSLLSLSSNSTPLSSLLSSSLSSLSSRIPRLSSSTQLSPTSASVTDLPKSANISNSTRVSSSTGVSNATTTSLCTGCVIQAQNPITTFFKSTDVYNQWTNLLVTETIVTSFISYNDTVLTQTRTVNQTKTLVLPENNRTITHHTPTFKVTPTYGVVLTLDAGPTYVIWQDIYGGPDRSVSVPDASICSAVPTQLKNWQPKRKEDWDYFIQTYSRNSTAPKNTETAIPIPSDALQYLQNNLAIQSQFQGSDIATCTFHSTFFSKTHQPAFTLIPHPSPALPHPDFTTQRPGAPPPEAPQRSSPAAYPTLPAPIFTATTGTFLSTTYATTVTHVTRAGCLRCQDTVPVPGPTPDDPRFSNKIIDKPEPTPKNPDESQPSGNPDGPSKPNDNANDPSKPENSPKPNDQRPPGIPVVIGGSTYTVNPVRQTPQPDRPSEQNHAPPVVVIGSQTLTPGQSTTINGVPVIVPTPTPGDRGPRIVVNGETIDIPLNSSPTGAPILTVGTNTITANSQGQFVVGSQTLKPGGPAVTVDGSTLSLASNGGIAVLNGVTRTLQNAPVITPAPVITLGGRVVSATAVGSNTQYIIGTQTLVPGSAITVDGVTYSLPSSENSGKIIVNGVTSTLNVGQSSVTIGQQYVTASIKDGTTSYVFSPSQTLTPGGVVTASGTTFSMPASASGSVVVVNGVTSTIQPNPNTTPLALTINGRTYTATVRSGTSEFVLGPGTTLRPGEAVTMSGTTYSLDAQGTALVINGQTSSIPRVPASNSATTTATRSTTTSARDVGNFIWSGIGGGGSAGGSSSTGGGIPALRPGGLDIWIESMVIGLAGWIVMLL